MGHLLRDPIHRLNTVLLGRRKCANNSSRVTNHGPLIAKAGSDQISDIKEGEKTRKRALELSAARAWRNIGPSLAQFAAMKAAIVVGGVPEFDISSP